MTVALRCVLIVTSVFLTWFMLRKIRQSKIKIEDSIFWIMLSLLLVIFSLFPGLADILSDIVGTYSTSNFIFLLMIFILLMKVFSMSLKISQLERKVTELVQSLALSETKKGEKSEAKRS